MSLMSLFFLNWHNLLKKEAVYGPSLPNRYTITPFTSGCFIPTNLLQTSTK
ncbi:hypothetical protein Hanom_Chr04g00342141 [Helianthus anomalus]